MRINGLFLKNMFASNVRVAFSLGYISHCTPKGNPVGFDVGNPALVLFRLETFELESGD